MKVTDEMVKAARKAWGDHCATSATTLDDMLRAALEAALSHAAGQEGEPEAYWIGIVRRYRNPLQRFIRMHAQFDYDSDRHKNMPRSAEDWAAVMVDGALSGHPHHSVTRSEAAPPTSSAEVGQDGEQCRAASGDVLNRIADELELLVQSPFHPTRNQCREWVAELRALSRGMPEGK